MEEFVKVQLDESLYGLGWTALHKTYEFSRIDGNGNEDYITIQNGDGKVLYAVTKHQLKCWKNWKITSKRFKWGFGRIINFLSQVACKNDLVNPARDLYKLKYFLRKIFCKGETNE